MKLAAGLVGGKYTRFHFPLAEATRWRLGCREHGAGTYSRPAWEHSARSKDSRCRVASLLNVRLARVRARTKARLGCIERWRVKLVPAAGVKQDTP